MECLDVVGEVVVEGVIVEKWGVEKERTMEREKQTNDWSVLQGEISLMMMNMRGKKFTRRERCRLFTSR